MNRVISLLLAFACLAATPARSGTLFIGTDTEEFGGVATSYLVKATVNGANFVSQTNIVLTFPLNGLGDGPGFLYSGDPNTNTLRRIDYNGNLLSSVTGGFPNVCCNEELQFANGSLYHAHYNDNIQKIDPITGAVLQTLPRSNVVGMALVGSTLWITNWDARQVGTWDPATNVFSPVFVTPQLAGALAYDPDTAILWVGQLGGQVVPYDLAGNALNAGFNPIVPLNLGVTIDTVDGLTFLGEGTQTSVPEPGALGLLLIGVAGLARLRRKAR